MTYFMLVTRAVLVKGALPQRRGHSAADMRDFLQSLQGRHKVKMVCIDMNPAYRRLVREWFPNARLVADRFHVIRLVNQIAGM